MRTLLIALAGLVVAMPGMAIAATIVINNGLAPPNPANLIDSANSFPSDFVRVQNVGCDSTVVDPCPMPWGDPTSVNLVAGGAVGGAFVAFESSIVTMSGGSVGGELVALYSSSVTMSGGLVRDDLEALDSSSVTMSGGSVAGNIFVAQSSKMTMSGGSVGGNLRARQSSSAALSRGTVQGNLLAWDTSSVTMSGGSVGLDLAAEDFSTVTMKGGSVASDIRASDSSTVIIVGTAFAVDGIPVGYGPISASSGTLTGTLESGALIDNFFARDPGATIIIREPGTLFFSDFEANNGGLTGSLDWEWGTYSWAATCSDSSPPPAPHSGTNMWATVLNDCYNNLGNNSGFDTCVNDNPADDSILSFTVDLSDYSAAWLSWWEWFDVFTHFDWAEVYVNGDVVFQHCGTDYVIPTKWVQHEVDISAHAGGSANIEFHMMASSVIERAGWFIDDVLVSLPEPRTGLLQMTTILMLAAFRRRAA